MRANLSSWLASAAALHIPREPVRRGLPLAAAVLGLGLLLGPAQAMDFERLGAMARERAAQPHDPAPTRLPDSLAALDYDQVRDIRWRPERALWRDTGNAFEAMFFHLGLYQTAPVRVHEVTPQGTRTLAYRPQDFDYGRNRVRPDSWGPLGFAGFRLHYPLNSPAYKDELIVFQGASYFRALGAGQQYGLSARGIAVDTVGGRGEEFPRFTDFWLVRPDAGAAQVTVYALLDGPRVTGAYRFDVTPGTSTVTTVRGRVYLRGGGAPPIATLGIAPLTSMFFFGENQPRPGDFRPEVHDSDGLMVATGEGEWLWRPLQNPKAKLVTSFATRNPRGFGLMQRDRAWHSYEDVEARYERRPSAWVRPLGDWGAGRVELVQLPTPDETHDNIVAYWVPERLPAPGTPLDFAYELHWQGDAQQRPPGAWVTQSRRGMGYTRLPADALARQVQYVVDFAGPALDALPHDAPVRAVVSTDTHGRVAEAIAYRNPATQSWRATVRIERTRADRPIEVRAFLQHQSHAVSETWTHVILPE